MAIGWQLIIRRRDDAVLAPGVESRRAFSRCVARVGAGFPVVAFHAPDGHAHVPVLSGREAAGALAKRLAVGLGQVLGHAGELEPVRLRPVHDQAHARNLFRYVLDQARHHGVEPDPFHEASALPDLLGLRLPGAWLRGVVAERLPRVRRGLLVELLGVEPRELVEGNPALLAEAAAAALGRGRLVGRQPEVVQARAAAVVLGSTTMSGGEVGQALGLPPRTVQRLRHREVPPAVLAAVRDQWRLRTWVSRQG